MEPNDPFSRRHRRACGTHSGMAPALVLIAIGAIFFLNNLSIIDVHEMVRFWPAIFIAMGLVKLVDANNSQGRTAGMILFGLGAVLLAQTMGFLYMRIHDLWPLILIGLGLMLLFQRIGPLWQGHMDDNRAETDGTIKQDAVFGGGKRNVVSQEFRGGIINAVFGGVELNFRKAQIAGDSAILRVSAVFGGIEIKVPDDWLVIIEVSAVFGGVEDTTEHPDPMRFPTPKKLIVRGSAVFGGVEVKN